MMDRVRATIGAITLALGFGLAVAPGCAAPETGDSTVSADVGELRENETELKTIIARYDSADPATTGVAYWSVIVARSLERGYFWVIVGHDAKDTAVIELVLDGDEQTLRSADEAVPLELEIDQLNAMGQDLSAVAELLNETAAEMDQQTEDPGAETQSEGDGASVPGCLVSAGSSVVGAFATLLMGAYGTIACPVGSVLLAIPTALAVGDDPGEEMKVVCELAYGPAVWIGSGTWREMRKVPNKCLGIPSD